MGTRACAVRLPAAQCGPFANPQTSSDLQILNSGEYGPKDAVNKHACMVRIRKVGRMPSRSSMLIYSTTHVCDAEVGTAAERTPQTWRVAGGGVERIQISEL